MKASTCAKTEAWGPLARRWGRCLKWTECIESATELKKRILHASTLQSLKVCLQPVRGGRKCVSALMIQEVWDLKEEIKVAWRLSVSDLFKGCRINERWRPEGGVSRRERVARWGILLACQENQPWYQRRWCAKFTSEMFSSYFQLYLCSQPVIQLLLLSSRDIRKQVFSGGCKNRRKYSVFWRSTELYWIIAQAEAALLESGRRTDLKVWSI